MQYLIKISGNVLNTQSKMYAVNASSKEEAVEKAKENFEEEFNSSDVLYAKPYKRTNRAMLAILFMLIPVLLSFINWKTGHETITIKPSYISCLYASIFYAAFIIRFKGILQAVKSWIDILLMVEVILLFSSFVQTLLVTQEINVLGLIQFDIDANLVIIAAIVLSLLGMKLVSVICLVGVGIMALLNVTMLNNAMGNLFGPMYVVCTFVGFVLYISVEPAMYSAIPYIGRFAVKGVQYMKNDFVQAGHAAGNIKNSMENSLNINKSIKSNTDNNKGEVI